MTPTFFPTPSDFRTWLEEHSDQAQELWVGYYKKASGKPSITWPESVDEALCFGWIDGLRKSIDEISYKIRFTPRKPTSNWSKVNIERVQELSSLGRMHPAGLEAFEKRKEEKSGIYAYEQRETAALSEAEEQQFRAHPKAWESFQAQSNSYRKTSIWWVVSAKKEETRQSRLSKLIEDSAQGRTIPPLTRPGKPN
jgi:uncharacterized protein YdeI (YjbR/CyaY-like superfamily)